MAAQAGNILDTIAEKTRERVLSDIEIVSRDDMRAKALEIANAELAANAAAGLVDDEGNALFEYRFMKNLFEPGMQFICEAKKASPSKGVIAQDFPYLEIARSYEEAGAAAISCLTEPHWFLGSDTYLYEIAQAVDIPVLRKDFVVDEYMVYQAKVLGAEAILLIVAILDDEQLRAWHELALSLGLSVLVEAHDEEEISRALAAGARIIGVNNRNLKDFTVDINHAGNLRELVPQDVLFVAESGISGADDVAAAALSGADAVLVGEALMRSEDKAATLASFKKAAADALAGENA